MGGISLKEAQERYMRRITRASKGAKKVAMNLRKKDKSIADYEEVIHQKKNYRLIGRKERKRPINEGIG